MAKPGLPLFSWVRQHKAFVAAGALILLADRASKVWALTYLAQHGPVRFGTYLWLNYVQNTGAAFGLFQNANVLLIAVMLAVIGYLIYTWRDLSRYGCLARWGAVCMLSGALGNLYDRITLGFVVDFIDMRVWPVFNVADSFITVGAVLLGVCLLQKPHPAEEKA